MASTWWLAEASRRKRVPPESRFFFWFWRFQWYIVHHLLRFLAWKLFRVRCKALLRKSTHKRSYIQHRRRIVISMLGLLSLTFLLVLIIQQVILLLLLHGLLLLGPLVVEDIIVVLHGLLWLDHVLHGRFVPLLPFGGVAIWAASQPIPIYVMLTCKSLGLLWVQRVNSFEKQFSSSDT